MRSLIQFIRRYSKPELSLAILALFIFLIHLYFVASTAVNVPYMDEWDNLPKNTLSLEWLLRPHNEHRIFFTKLQNYLHLKIDSWNLHNIIICNFFLYAFFLVCVIRFFFLHWPKNSSHTTFIFSIILLLSGLPVQNHSWGFQSQFHFFLIFGVLGLTDLSQKRALRGFFWLICAALSFSAGMIWLGIAALAWAFFQYLNLNNKQLQRRVGSIAVVFIIGIAILFLIRLLSQNPEATPPSKIFYFPWKIDFWIHFNGIIALGLGILGRHSALGIFSLSIVLGLVYLNFKLLRNTRDSSSSVSPDVYWPNIFMLAVLASMAAISVGRANYGVENSKSSRYSEIALLLIPWIFWTLAKVNLSRVTWVSTLLLCLIHAPHYRYAYLYQREENGRLKGKECVIRTIQNHDFDGFCPEVYPGPAREKFLQAQSAKISFFSEVH